jgi:large subunit ribosomal protein L7A
VNRLGKHRNGQVVGLRETTKRLHQNRVQVLYVAVDAEARLIAPLVELAASRGCEIVQVPSMAELGRAVGIEVGAACAALIKEGSTSADD